MLDDLTDTGLRRRLVRARRDLAAAADVARVDRGVVDQRAAAELLWRVGELEEEERRRGR